MSMGDWCETKMRREGASFFFVAWLSSRIDAILTIMNYWIGSEVISGQKSSVSVHGSLSWMHIDAYIMFTILA